MGVIVFGSINMDLVVRTARLPKPGESFTGHSFFTAGGGKGANQAVACARMGVPTRLVGKVGGDVFGTTLRQDLQGYGVDISGVSVQPAQSSGVAVISVDDSAENCIIIVPGANGDVGHDDVERVAAMLNDVNEAQVLLLQLEIPLESVVDAAQLAHQRGVTVILDPAPARPLPTELYTLIDILTPNETEATALTGFPVESEQDAAKAAAFLMRQGLKNLIVKMGAKGVYWHGPEHGERGQVFPAYQVTAVDTVAAGDAFNGGLAAALAEGRPFIEAIRWGLAVSALSVTKAGAQPSMPDRAAVMELMAQQPR
jgi:ribokinase